MPRTTNRRQQARRTGPTLNPLVHRARKRAEAKAKADRAARRAERAAELAESIEATRAARAAVVPAAETDTAETRVLPVLRPKRGTGTDAPAPVEVDPADTETYSRTRTVAARTEMAAAHAAAALRDRLAGTRIVRESAEMRDTIRGARTSALDACAEATAPVRTSRPGRLVGRTALKARRAAALKAGRKVRAVRQRVAAETGHKVLGSRRRKLGRAVEPALYGPAVLAASWAVVHAADSPVLPGVAMILTGGEMWRGKLHLTAQGAITREKKGPYRYDSLMRATTYAAAVWFALPAGPFPDLMGPARWPIIIGAAASAAAMRVVRAVSRGDFTAVEPVEAMAPSDGSDEAYSAIAREIWDGAVGCPDTPMSGSRITNVRWSGVGTFRAVVECVGNQDVETLRMADRTIARAYKISTMMIEVISSDDSTRPEVVVTLENGLKSSVPWAPAPLDAKTGMVDIGTYVDGTRVRFKFLLSGGGTTHAAFCGGTGSGKTACVTSVLARIMGAGLVCLDMVDLGEVSLPEWTSRAFRFGETPDDAYIALKRACAVIDSRRTRMKKMRTKTQEGLTTQGISKLPVTTDDPAYLLVIEEAPALALCTDKKKLKEITTMLELIGKQGRKFAVSLWWISQNASLKDGWMNMGDLRQNVSTGLVVGLWARKSAGSMAFGGGLEVDLSKVPKGMGGMGYVGGCEGNRATMFRSDWLEDAPSDGRSTLPKDVHSPEWAASHYVPGILHPDDQAAVASIEAEYGRGGFYDAGRPGAEWLPQIEVAKKPATAGRISAAVSGVPGVLDVEADLEGEDGDGELDPYLRVFLDLFSEAEYVRLGAFATAMAVELGVDDQAKDPSGWNRHYREMRAWLASDPRVSPAGKNGCFVPAGH